MTADEIVRERMKLKDQIAAVIGADLNGFHLDDLAIHDVQRAD